jgi:hypothetical protein
MLRPVYIYTEDFSRVRLAGILTLGHALRDPGRGPPRPTLSSSSSSTPLYHFDDTYRRIDKVNARILARPRFFSLRRNTTRGATKITKKDKLYGHRSESGNDSLSLVEYQADIENETSGLPSIYLRSYTSGSSRVSTIHERWCDHV